MSEIRYIHQKVTLFRIHQFQPLCYFCNYVTLNFLLYTHLKREELYENLKDI